MALPEPSSLSEEKLKEYDSVTLFMRSLPEPGELSDDTAISALQSLIHEGTPDGGVYDLLFSYLTHPIQRLPRTSRSKGTNTSKISAIERLWAFTNKD